MINLTARLSDQSLSRHSRLAMKAARQMKRAQNKSSTGKLICHHLLKMLDENELKSMDPIDQLKRRNLFNEMNQDGLNRGGLNRGGLNPGGLNPGGLNRGSQPGQYHLQI